MIYQSGYNASGLVIGVWLYHDGTITPLSQQLPGVTGCEDVSSLVGTAGMPSIGWTRTGPLTYSPPAASTAPDPLGFAVAVQGASTVAAATRHGTLSMLFALSSALEAGDASQIAGGWSDAIAANSISTSDRAAIAALASQHNIPGIT